MKKLNVQTEHSSVLAICLFVLAVLFVGLPHQAEAQYQPPDSCLKMIFPNEGLYWNPDSVRVDSCDGSPTYLKQFARKYYYIQFPENYYPFDTILTDKDIKRVSEISNKHISFKNKFEQLENEFGIIYFTGFWENEPDSSFMLNPIIKMIFEKYQDYEFIEEYYKNNLDSVRKVYYYYQAKILLDSKVDEVIINNNIIIYPHPVFDILIFKKLNSINSKIIQVITIEGVILKEFEFSEKIDVSDIPIGIYFLKVGYQYIKFIKI